MSVRDNLSAPKAAAITVLDTLEEVTANTSSGKPAGALAVKQLNTNLSNLSTGLNNFKSVNANVSFSNGKGTYTDSSIKTTSRIIASRILSSSVGVFIAGAKAYNGYCEIFMSSSSSGGTESLMIMIDNR